MVAPLREGIKSFKMAGGRDQHDRRVKTIQVYRDVTVHSPELHEKSGA